MRDNPTVWHVSSNRWNSAITEYAISCARALAGAGHKTVFTPLAGSLAEGRARYSNLDTRSMRGFGIMQLKAFLRLLDSIQPDIVFAYGGAETTLALLAKLSLHRFRLIRFRGQAVPEHHPLTQVRHTLGHLGVNAFLAPGEILAESLRPFTGRTPVHSVILGVDTEQFRYTPRFHGKVARPELLVVGRFDPIKGHVLMMRLFQRILSQWPSDALRPRLHFIGQEANIKLTDLQAEARQIGLKIGDDLVITCERHPDIAGAMTHATVGSVPSLGSEIICRVAQEFLLCGTPVAVSGAGSLNEVLFPTAGLTWKGLPEEETAARLHELLWNAWNETPGMREARATQAQRLFSFETMAKSIQRACGY